MSPTGDRRPVRVVAVDLGATSGRVMAARVGLDPEVIELTEVHRFPNGAERHADGSLRWDLERLHREVLEGIRRAAATGPVDAIGIDSWAVDYGLIDAEGRLLGPAYSHRDGRTDGVADVVEARVGAARLYAETGLQRLPFNTLFQLVAGREDLAGAAHLLLVPDLITSWLTGRVVAERTNASTTQLYGARSREWSTDLLEELDLPTGLLPPLVDPGTVVGPVLDDVAAALGLPSGVPVVAVGSHDTASAVVGVPAGDEPFAYVSSGTWSLVGLELAEPVLTEAAREADFTNEAGVDGTTRFLQNVSGLWVLSECLRTWRAEGLSVELPDLLAAAAVHPSPGTFEIGDHRLVAPDDMPARVVALAREAGIALSGEPVELVRVVLDSLASAYARSVGVAARLAGVQPTVVHVVGGGSLNALLCQLTADACGLPVVAGPQEAAALGNVLVQARALGVDLPDLARMRALVRRTHRLRRFEPAGA
ncbi:rhamnulokinase family protein [Nocardioides korecus]